MSKSSGPGLNEDQIVSALLLEKNLNDAPVKLEQLQPLIDAGLVSAATVANLIRLGVTERELVALGRDAQRRLESKAKE